MVTWVNWFETAIAQYTYGCMNMNKYKNKSLSHLRNYRNCDIKNKQTNTHTVILVSVNSSIKIMRNERHT